MQLSYLGSFWAGVLSFFAPCLLPMVPIFIFYIAGEDASRGKRFVRTGGFVLGFTLIYVVVALGLGKLAGVLFSNRARIRIVAGIYIVLMGMLLVSGKSIFSGTIKKRPKIGGFFGAVVFGILFAAGLSPCYGPILAGILALSSTSPRGYLYLLFYALGLAIPFFAAALFLDRFETWTAKNDKLWGKLPRISGIFLILFGILLMAGKMS